MSGARKRQRCAHALALAGSRILRCASLRFMRLFGAKTNCAPARPDPTRNPSTLSSRRQHSCPWHRIPSLDPPSAPAGYLLSACVATLLNATQS